MKTIQGYLESKIFDFLNKDREIEELDLGYEFLGTFWKGQTWNFNDVLELEDDNKVKSISISFESLSNEERLRINELLPCSIKSTSNLSDIKELFGSPLAINNYDENTELEYLLNGEYYLSFTFRNNKDFIFFVCANYVYPFITDENNQLDTPNTEFNVLLEKRKQEKGIISFEDFQKLRPEYFADEFSILKKFEYMGTKWLANRWGDRSALCYNIHSNDKLELISLGFDDLTKSVQKNLSVLFGFELNAGDTLSKIEKKLQTKHSKSERYSDTSAFYNFIIISNNHENYLLQVTIYDDNEIGAIQFDLTSNVKLNNYNWDLDDFID